MYQFWHIPVGCLTCNKLFFGETNFCDQCGSIVQKACIHCGNEVNVNDIFCDQCGKRLSHTTTETPQKISYNKEQSTASDSKKLDDDENDFEQESELTYKTEKIS